MLSGEDEGPVYYREIQKNSYLKRIPNESSTSKLRPLKKPPLKAMWTLFCVHNGRVPFLEQYPEPDSASTVAHRPAWRACLRSARHVTASVKPHAGEEYDFLVDTDHGPIRMLAPDWDSMQDWVSILRSKLHELRILSRGENVYGAPPVAPTPRAAARDPTSPLPPTPPVPPDRVPGIDLTPITQHRPTIDSPQPATTSNATATVTNTNATAQTSNAQGNETPRTAANTTNTSTATNITYSSSNLNQTNVTTNFTNATGNFTNATGNFTNATGNFTNATANFTNATANFTNTSAKFTNITTNFINATANITNTSANFTSTTTNFTNITANITNTTVNFTNTTANVTFTDTTVSFKPINTNITTFTNATASLTNVSSLTGQDMNAVDISHWEPYSLPSTSRDVEPKKSVAKICGQNICVDDSVLKRNVTESDEEFFAEIDKIHDSADDISDFDYKQRVVVNNCGGFAESEQNTAQRSNITVIQVSNKGPPHTAIPVLGPERDVFDFEFKQNVTVSPNRNADFVNIVTTEGQAENSYGTVFDKPHSDYDHISLTTTVSLTGDVSLTDVKDGVYERLCMASTSNKTASPLPIRKVKSANVRKSSLPNMELESDYEYLFPNSSQNGSLSRNLPNGSEPQSNNGNGRKIVPNGSDVRSNLPNSRINSRSNQLSDRSNLPNETLILPHGREIRPNLPVSLTILPNGRNDVSNSTSEVPRVISNANESNLRTLTTNIERSQSQNAYDVSPRRRDNIIRRVPNNSPKREAKVDKPDQHPPKPIWRRGLTELSLLSRLRGIGQTKRPESPTRQDQEERGVTSSVKVIHRSRPAGRVDSSRRRSNSLTNSQSPSVPVPAMQPLRARQAAALRAEQRRGACAATTVPVRDAPLLCDYERQVWVARWGASGYRSGGRAGDRVAGLAGTQPCSATHGRHLLKTTHGPLVDVLFHRVPLGKIYVISKKDQENLGEYLRLRGFGDWSALVINKTGIKLDNECTIVSVEGQSPAGKAGLPPPGRWAVTEVNNRPINLVKGGEEEMNRIAMHGSEVSVLIQPAALVKKMRAAIKGSKPLLGIR